MIVFRIEIFKKIVIYKVLSNSSRNSKKYLNIFYFLRKAAKRIDKLDTDFDTVEKELRTLQNCNSEYIVKYIGFEEDTNYFYVLMKLYEVIRFC